MKSSETAARTASSTSRPKRVRFSRLPPYSSVRVLMAGSKNCSIRCPPNEVTSHPSQPQRSRRAAASAKRCTIAGISDASSGTGTSRWTPSGRSDGARSGMPVSVDVPRRPMCVICDMHSAPWPWTPSASARSCRLVALVPQRDRAVRRRGRRVDRGRAERHDQRARHRPPCGRGSPPRADRSAPSWPHPVACGVDTIRLRSTLPAQLQRRVQVREGRRIRGGRCSPSPGTPVMFPRFPSQTRHAAAERAAGYGTSFATPADAPWISRRSVPSP